MQIFNPPHFLRHIGMPTLREFTEALPFHNTWRWTEHLTQRIAHRRVTAPPR